MNRRITLKDIAGKAGVTVACVSLALRDSPQIASATKERIRDLAEKLGYRPDPTLTRFERNLTINAHGDLEIADDFEFSESPAALQEVFTTYLPCEAEGDGVRIGGTGGMILKSKQPGSFAVELHQVDSPCAPEDKTLRRIVFTPASLKERMFLSFGLHLKPQSTGQ